jgi:hypothetical protein
VKTRINKTTISLVQYWGALKDKELDKRESVKAVGLLARYGDALVGIRRALKKKEIADLGTAGDEEIDFSRFTSFRWTFSTKSKLKQSLQDLRRLETLLWGALLTVLTDDEFVVLWPENMK